MAPIPDTFNLALQHHHAGRVQEAEALYRQILQAQPAIMEAHYNLANLLCEEGKFEEAVAQYRQALELKPDCAEACLNLGNVLQTQGRLEDALVQYRHALVLKPDNAEAYNNLAGALLRQGKLSEAEAAYRGALALKPDYAEALGNLGNVLKDQGRLEEAEVCYRRALTLKPDYADAHSNLLFALNYHPDKRGEEIYAAYREYDTRFGVPHRGQWRPHSNSRDTTRRLKVGYVSPDFYTHSVCHFLEPLLAHHDKGEVEVYAYAECVREDAVTERFKRYVDHWVPTRGLTDDVLAERIRADGIDILVDLAGHTAGNRLLVFARKPAPVQVTYLGYGATTGLSAMDYRLTDEYLSPSDSPEWCSEELIRLPACVACYRTPVDALSVGPLPAVAAGHVTFGSFNNLAKVTPAVVLLWAQILQRLPESRLILKDITLDDEGQCARYLSLFERHGVKAARIELLPKTSMQDYLAQYGRVDIALDPFPFNGFTTTCEALWMGVPVVTLAGVTSYGRFGVSLLSNLGLTHLIAATPDAYVEKALALANDHTRLKALRAELRPRMAASSLCDAKTLTCEVEKAYRSMWRRWCGSGA